MTALTRPHWRGAELALVRREYARLGAAGLAALLPGRSITAIKIKAHQLAVSRPNRRWTNREHQILRTHFPAGGSAACASLLPHLSPHQIMRRARDIGVRRTRHHPGTGTTIAAAAPIEGA